MKVLQGGKYQTNLVIFTDDFTKEFYRESEKAVIPLVKNLLANIKNKLDKVRKIDFIGNKLPNEQLLWGLLFPIMRKGKEALEGKFPEYQEKKELYHGAGGTAYGSSENEEQNEYSCHAFAGFTKIDERFNITGADFGILPDKNRYFNRKLKPINIEEIREEIYRTVLGDISPKNIIVTGKQKSLIMDILQNEITQMEAIYLEIFKIARNIMKVHAPNSINDQVDRIIFQTLFFRTVGLIGYYAVKSEELIIPDVDACIAIIINDDSQDLTN